MSVSANTSQRGADSVDVRGGVSCPPSSEAASGQLISVETAVFGNDTQSRSVQKQWQEMPLVRVHLWRDDPRPQQWVVLSLMTNLPCDPFTQLVGGFTFAEIAAVFAQRGDSEVFFKQEIMSTDCSHSTNGCHEGADNAEFVDGFGSDGSSVPRTNGCHEGADNADLSQQA